ncbi:hypothetical protein [Mycobacterium hubeiense]|uniref:hypothetical protein n=1 Tax=Mycobacterium hubeiense TaxID=1867256 RepID=UPI001E5C4B52|nr:hypothetical protein [Mycobacterium sp. QGD 101]
MKPLRPMLRRAVRPATAVGAIVAAAAVWHHLPASTDIYAPFEVRGVIGVPTTGRGISATVTGVRISKTITVDSVLARVPIPAAGIWVLIDTTLASGPHAEIPDAQLIVGPNTYRPTDRLPIGNALGDQLQPGFTSRGAWVFDVDPKLLDAAGTTLHLQIWVGDGRLDSRLDISIDRTDSRVSTLDTTALQRPIRAAS